jgi:hypothetical protein
MQRNIETTFYNLHTHNLLFMNFEQAILNYIKPILNKYIKLKELKIEQQISNLNNNL